MVRLSDTSERFPEYRPLLAKLQEASADTSKSDTLTEIARGLEKVGFRLPAEGHVKSWDGDYYINGRPEMTNAAAFRQHFVAYIEELQAAIEDGVSIAAIQRRNQEDFNRKMKEALGNKKPKPR